jgi:hypothetical protein
MRIAGIMIACAFCGSRGTRGIDDSLPHSKCHQGEVVIPVREVQFSPKEAAQQRFMEKHRRLN